MADIYLDSDVSTQFVGVLVSHGHRARSARDEGRESARDPEQLLFAAERGWMIVTHNKKDYRLLHVAWQVWSAAWRTSQRHAGILILEQTAVEDFAPAVLDLIGSDVQVSNQLYEWSRTHGWRPNPSP